jgi:ABC-type transport system substrate-binding protein
MMLYALHDAMVKPAPGQNSATCLAESWSASEAANLAIDRPTINQALTLGYSHLTNSVFPENLEFFWRPPPPVSDPLKAKQLLADAGFPNGFDAGFYTCDAAYANLGEAVRNNLQTLVFEPG